MAFTEEKVYHLDEFIKYVTYLGRSRGKRKDSPPVLWARGHREQDWALLPTLLRDVDLDVLAGGGGTASGRAVEEELRKQHYIAKNYHFLAKEPKANLEWMEVMQHHSVKTRLMDWSESTLHAVLFSLECFLDNQRYRKQERIDCSPCIWLFEPNEWNMVAIKKILSSDKTMDICIERLGLPSYSSKKKEIKNRIKSLSGNIDDYMKMKSAEHLKGIFNLSSIFSELQALERSDLLYFLENGEYYYCLFYVLVNIYLEKELKDLNEVLPLAIVESYHSERIRAQKGAFSIFPFYEETSLIANARKIGINLDAMENMSAANQYLHKIVLGNPDEIAYEVMNAGLNVSWLYPEMPIVSNAIEKRKIFM